MKAGLGMLSQERNPEWKGGREVSFAVEEARQGLGSKGFLLLEPESAVPALGPLWWILRSRLQRRWGTAEPQAFSGSYLCPGLVFNKQNLSRASTFTWSSVMTCRLVVFSEWDLHVSLEFREDRENEGWPKCCPSCFCFKVHIKDVTAMSSLSESGILFAHIFSQHINL